ncbi:MAG: POTRA domain-containing protein, partial [Planctomycetota bacterium]|nr:POTRA domain-containing protein [Planctomycetota bacterium]
MRFISTVIIFLISFITSSALSSTLQDSRVSAILFEGLDRVTEQRVKNLIQSTVGQPYDFELVEGDVHTLNHLGEFNYITADVVLQEDGTIHVIYTFREHQVITEVAVVGNSMISDKELLA